MDKRLIFLQYVLNMASYTVDDKTICQLYIELATLTNNNQLAEADLHVHCNESLRSNKYISQYLTDWIKEASNDNKTNLKDTIFNK